MPPKNKPRAREPSVTPPAEPEATPDDESIKLSCRIALNAFRSGNQRSALTMINESYQKCGLVQRTKATVLFAAFFQLEDRSLQDFSLKSAVSAAKEATSWSPKSIEFAQFYCFLFYLNSDDDKAYAKLEEECRYALSIEDPIDPVEESVLSIEDPIDLVEESVQEKAKTINVAKEKLVWLVGKLNKDSVTAKPSMEKKIMRIARKMGMDDNQVAAAMLLRLQKSGKWVERFEMRTLIYLQRSVERIHRIWHCWKESCHNDKSNQAIFDVKLSRLKSFFSSEKNKSLNYFLDGAIRNFWILEKQMHYKTFRFWQCYHCDREFIEYHSMWRHFMYFHFGHWAQKLQDTLFLGLNNWDRMIGNPDCTEEGESRAIILKRIRASFRLLLGHQFLCISHVYQIMQYTASELQMSMNQTTSLSLSCLSSSQLKGIEELLTQLVQACELILKNVDSFMDSQTPVMEAPDSSTDYSYSASLFLENCLAGKIIFSRDKADGKDFIYWLFHGPTSAYKDALKSYIMERGNELKQGREIVLSFDNLSMEMKSACAGKLNIIEYLKELEDMEKLLAEVGGRRDPDLNYVTQSFESLLMKQLFGKEGGRRDPDLNYVPQSVESLLRKQLKERSVDICGFKHLRIRMLFSKAMKIQQKKPGGNTGRKHPPSDKCLLEVILAEKREHHEKIAKIDAKVMKILVALREMELQLETLSAVDNRKCVFPLMKLYTRAKLEKRIDNWRPRLCIR